MHVFENKTKQNKNRKRCPVDSITCTWFDLHQNNPTILTISAGKLFAVKLKR